MALTTAPIRFPIFSPTLPDPAELRDEMAAIFASGRVTVGNQVAKLEEEVSARLGVRNVIGVSCGTNALLLLLRALELPAGGEVITPTFTFAATAQALLWHGLQPVFCDSDPETFTMDAAAAEALITEKTVAIYPVNIFGVPGDLDAYQALADRHGLHLLYDSAQGIGSTYHGRAVGTFGEGECFSMSPTKVVTAMEGGLITTNNDEMAYRLRFMRDYGKAPDGEDMRWLGLSARMSEVNALVGRWSFARLDDWVRIRTAIMDRYMANLAGIPGISYQRIPEGRASSRNYIVILLDPERAPVTRDEMYARLKEEGVQTKRYFYPALHNQTVFRDVDPGGGARLPVAERISASALALPMSSHMTLETVDDICEIVENCCMALV
jgi:dTDP-4-amino-4,6-dideoxygalactose transaminase